MNKTCKKIIIINSIVIGLLIILCLIRIAFPNKTYTYDISGSVYSEEASYSTVICENIALPAGTYDVMLDYTPMDEDLPCFFNVADGSVFAGGLLSDGDRFWAGTTNTYCRITLFESTEAMYGYLDVGIHSPYFEYGKLTFKETNHLWVVLITNLIILWGLVFILTLFFSKVREGKISKERKLEIIVLGAITLFGSAYFLYGFIPLGADQGYHLERIESVAYSILDGVFPIRLEPYYPFGYGYADGLFYCDISLYIPAFFRILGFTMQSSFNIFGMICIFSGALTTHICFKKIFKNVYMGLLGAALNNISMYYLFDTVVRGGTGALVSSIFFPLLLYGYFRLFSEDINSKSYKTIWIPISIGYTGILCSHVLSMEITAFWTVIVLFTMIRKVFRSKTFLELWKALGAVILLNIWYLVPFLDYYKNENIIIKNVSARQIQEWGFVFSNFIRPPFMVAVEPKVETVHNIFLLFNPVVFFLIFVFLILWIAGAWKKFKDDKFMKLAKVCCVYSIVSIILSSQYFPWDYLHSLNPLFEKLISALQFPHRFVAYLDLFSAITVCALIYGLWQYKSCFPKFAVTSLTIVSILVYSLNFIDYTSFFCSYTHLYGMSMFRNYLAGAEYAVWGTDFMNIHSWVCAQASDGVEITAYEKEDLAAQASVINDSDEYAYIDFPLLHYKGYKAFDSAKNELECIKSDLNYVRVNIPPLYVGDISVRFVSPWYWRVSEAISYIAWIFIIIYIIKKRKDAKKCQ